MENNDGISWKKFILIIIFSILFSYVVQDAIRLVIFKFLGISVDSYGLANWGGYFFLRIIASVIGTATGTFIIGSFLKHKAKLAALISVTPTTLLWLAVLFFGFQMTQKHGYSFENVKMMLLLPGSLVILSPVVALFSVKIGMESFDSFERKNCVLNIKWFHWIWILPLYLSKAVAVPLFCLILLWKVDFLYDQSGAYPNIFDLISNWGYYIRGLRRF